MKSRRSRLPRSPQARDPLAFIDAWRAKRHEALALVEALQRAEDAQRRAENDGERTRERLSAALLTAGVVHDQTGDLEALIEAAETALGDEAKLATLRQKAEERRVEAARAEAKLKIAEEADARWLRAWRETCSGTWLGEGGGEPGLGAVKQSLKALEELRATLNVCAELEDRIAKMERDKSLFANEVAAVAAALDLEYEPDDVRRRADVIEESVARSRENARRHAEKVEAIEEAHGRLKAITGEREVNARQASAMTSFFAVGVAGRRRRQARRLQTSRRAQSGDRAREGRDYHRQRGSVPRSLALDPREGRPGGARSGACGAQGADTP